MRLLLEWAAAEEHVKVLALSRNFGHQLAVKCGLDHSNGDAVVIIDADLQDPPEVISSMLAGYCEGYDIVFGQRKKRSGETWFKLLTASLFYRLIGMLFPQLPPNVGDFRLLAKRVVDCMRHMPEHDPFLRGLFAWVGFPQKAVLYDRPGREHGETKYPLFKMLPFAIRGIVSFSNLPLRLSIWAGMATMLVSLMLIVRTFYVYAFAETPVVPGWSSLMIAISFFSGAILLSVGTVGIYIARIHTEILQRPLYLVAHKANI